MAALSDHPYAVSGLAGVLAHAVVNRHEPDSIPGMLALIFAPPLVLSFGAQLPILPAFVLYLLALSASIVLYRVSPFHPLAKYPGPLLARVSRVYWSFASSSGLPHIRMQRLHERYGDVVRTGPNHLSIRDAAATPAIFGARGPWAKHGIYDLSRPYGGAAALLNLQGAEHAKRRRLWDRAFAPGSLAAYTPMLQARVAQFVAALAARAGTGARVDLTRWIQFLTLDFMGDFAYGGAFNALQSDADPDGLLATIAQGTAFVACVGWLPWLRPLVVALASGPGARLFAASRTVGERRKARGAAHKDLFYYVLGGDGGAGEALHPNTLAQEAVTAIIAGTDTSARTLLCAVFFLLAQPAALARVRAEVDGVVRELGDADAGLDPARLAQLPFLQAVLNETMRLRPVLPSGVPRLAPRGAGSSIVGQYVVPEGTCVQVPSYALQRDPRYFSPHSNSFWPERWLPEGREQAAAMKEEFVHNTAAFSPFSFGPHNCAGRALALLEMREILAEFLRHFDVRLAEGMTTELWERDLRDTFTLTTGSFWVVLEKRT